MVASQAIKEIARLLKREQKLIVDTNGHVKKINKTHQKLRITSVESLREQCDVHATAGGKLREYYDDALATASEEMRVLRDLLLRLENIAGIASPLKKPVSTTTKKRRTTGPPVEKTLKKGDTVVAYLPTDNSYDYCLCYVDHLEGDMVILTDYEPAPGQEDKRHKVPRDKVLPIETDIRAPVFPEGTRVIALFPSTTVFYAATVVSAPKKPGDIYRIHFDDDVTETGEPIPFREVAQSNVLPFPS